MLLIGSIPGFKSDSVVLWDRTSKKDTVVGIIDEPKSIIETPERGMKCLLVLYALLYGILYNRENVHVLGIGFETGLLIKN